MNENLEIHDQLKTVAVINELKTITEEELEKINSKNK